MNRVKISIHKATFFAYHGYYPYEQKTGHHFVVDLSVYIDFPEDIVDDILQTVDYTELYKICADEMSNTQKLIESVAMRIVQRIKNKVEQTTTGYIKIKKLAPILGGPTKGTSIKLYW